MNGERTAPTSAQVVAAIARREVTMALRRRLVKLLFLGNLIPPLGMAVALIANIVAKGIGVEDLGWDPLATLIQVQAGPVLLLALGIGTPLVARDRSEDVLFLYATRPVTPWSYTIGKMLAVAVPAVGLLVVPGVLMAILRAGLMNDFGLVDSLVLLGKVLVAGALMAWGYAGVSVGPSAAAKKARWALLIAFACFVIPDIVSQIVWHGDGYGLSPAKAVDHVIHALFDNEDLDYGVFGAVSLVVWGVLGALVTSARVRKEMTP
jgi:ABC-type transport system involved in multi-copper enzyme maturation permease subunit